MSRHSVIAALLLTSWPLLAQQVPIKLPRGAVQSSGAAYDSARHRVVACLSGEALMELGPLGWLHRSGWPFLVAQPGGPWPVVEPELIYDSVRHRTLLLTSDNGVDSVTLAYDGARISLVGVSVPGPLWRWHASVAFDTARSEVVLFGGQDTYGLLSNETWTFDGMVWTQHFSGTTPAPRHEAACAYDSARQKTVLFGGSNGIGFLSDTWEWDGVAWSQANPSNPPAARASSAMAFDPLRNRTVLMGGSGNTGVLGDVFEYDGSQWILRQSLRPEARRFSHAMVFDDALGRIRILGGFDDLGSVKSTASYDGTQFSPEAAMEFGPDLLTGFAFCPAPDFASALLFGGRSFSMEGKLWSFGGERWQLLSTTGPSPRENAAMATIGGNVYLFGGESTFGVSLGDTWRWNGAAWSQVTSSQSPGARTQLGLAPSNGGTRLLLYGGIHQGTTFDDTWLFDGFQWQQQSVSTHPSGRFEHALGYDQIRDRTVLFGGRDTIHGPLTDTWEWSGSSWNQILSVPSPIPLNPSLDFDQLRGRLVLAGHNVVVLGGAARQWFFDFDGSTWSLLGSAAMDLIPPCLVGAPMTVGMTVFGRSEVAMFPNTPPRTETYGVACSPDAPRLTGSALSRINTPQFGIEVVGAPANQFVVLVAAFTTALIPVGTCTLLVQPGQAAVLVHTNAGGFAAQALPLPNDLSLLGVDLFAQAGALSNNAQGFTLSDGLRLTIGS